MTDVMAVPTPTSEIPLCSSPPDVVVDALGATVALRFSADMTPGFRDVVSRAWEGARAQDAEQPDLVVEVPDPRLDGGHDRALSALSNDVTHRLIAHRLGQAWMVHAGGVADSQGRVCMLVGPSGAGKTTAVRRLSRAFAYVSDENVTVESDGRVHPYRKPLSIVVAGERWRCEIPPRALRLGDLPAGELRLAVIVILRRSSSAPATPRPTPVDTLTAIEELARQSSGLVCGTSPLATIAAHVRRAAVFRLEYRDNTELRPHIAALLDGAHAGSGAEVAVEPPSIEFEPRPRAGTIVTASFVDAVSDASDTLVLQRTTGDAGAVTRLTGIAPTIWRACRGGASQREIAAAVVAEHGLPPMGLPFARSLQSTIDVMQRGGLLREAGPSDAEVSEG
ncbi:hypothetical protein ACO03V_00660 [Microbacterium sp. HMH0099]|uniref:hypothetical protein n=1 Tax=Microbacterium sp. HMH0099 TaxID=3414026 RepID=UPI003BF652AF